ncbi:polysaccharide pyruvyl transferase family protein [Larkinella punicea]|uniref:Polysaccharide pyruvyl transferase family protein n=1 Tax=Larkinella punicea TaxID=2315727 RepID=A0A368JR57_9BACT|nr:polysaccharide pyruvyl transferase family protein [Larkinella punicea]RCR69063.1 polysaccharide pyruvyl transferase family protein [Larkinella punicea]
MQNRRSFLQQTPALIGLLMSIPSLANVAGAAKKTILLRSAWQTVNIGDIGHTPGILTLLERYLPDVTIQLWPSDIGNGVEELLQKRFPKVIILKGPEKISAAFNDCDFLLHSSGSSLVARKDVDRWHRETGKPFGIYGISLHGVFPTPLASNATSAAEVELISKAQFIFFRDSASLKFAKEKGITCPIMEYGPDAAFAVDLRDDASAKAFLEAHQLETGQFMCVIPRLRYTPYWKIPAKKAAFDEFKHTRNEEMKEHDHAVLREAISAVVRQTPMKILISPEDETQVAIGKEMLYDPLPADVKAKVVWRDRYWLTGEAISTYMRSAGLFGLEMHSPIMCVGNGIPAIVCRFDEQTSKGIMWRDIGLGDWLFDMDKPAEVARIVPTVLAMAKDPKTAKAKAARARTFVGKRQRETMAVVGKTLAV